MVRWWCGVGLLLLLLQGCASPKQALPQAIRGQLDLRSVNLSERSIPLEGEWAFYQV